MVTVPLKYILNEGQKEAEIQQNTEATGKSDRRQIRKVIRRPRQMKEGNTNKYRRNSAFMPKSSEGNGTANNKALAFTVLQ